jgi:hypothetical protein
MLLAQAKLPLAASASEAGNGLTHNAIRIRIETRALRDMKRVFILLSFSHKQRIGICSPEFGSLHGGTIRQTPAGGLPTPVWLLIPA